MNFRQFLIANLLISVLVVFCWNIFLQLPNIEERCGYLCLWISGCNEFLSKSHHSKCKWNQKRKKQTWILLFDSSLLTSKINKQGKNKRKWLPYMSSIFFWSILEYLFWSIFFVLFCFLFDFMLILVSSCVIA